MCLSFAGCETTPSQKIPSAPAPSRPAMRVNIAYVGDPRFEAFMAEQMQAQ